MSVKIKPRDPFLSFQHLRKPSSEPAKSTVAAASLSQHNEIELEGPATNKSGIINGSHIIRLDHGIGIKYNLTYKNRKIVDGIVPCQFSDGSIRNAVFRNGRWDCFL